MHGCNGHMGQVISGLVEKDPDAEIVAGIDVADQGKNSYPVYTNMEECQVEADALIDFSSAKATDALLAYCEKRKLPVVLCTTGLSEEQLEKVEETSKNVAVLKSANMSLGINTLMKLLQDAAKVLATAGFDMEIVEKHHRLKLDAPSGTALALADACVAKVARMLGKKEDAKYFENRSKAYSKYFDRESGLMRGRLLNGKFQSPFNPLKWGDAFTEGNAWHYTWSVFHDPEGLILLMGGKEKFNQMLDSVFLLPPVFDNSYYGFTIHEIREMQVMNMGNYAHGNQPIQHAIYLYDYSGQPWKCQYWIRQVMDKLYTPAPDGYCGDEDNGQTSAWYVFSAMGFYPVCPGSGQYVLGTPYFKSMKLHLENGKEVDIQSEGKGCYVDEMLLNGKSYQHNYLDMRSLMQGTQITYRLSEQPNLQRGIHKDDAPYSFSRK